MSDIPCPPYYTPPTTEGTLFFSTNDYVRNYNDWYQCIHPAYCNTPLFLGYNPPGIGEHSDEAWLRLEEGFPCNPNLTPSVSNSIGGGFSNVNANGVGGGGLILTRRPTSSPTTKNELPSLISGKIWYDANGDGRRNTPTNALTVMDFQAGEEERGSGVANMKVYLRYCRTGELAAVTYTYPREWEGSGGGGGSGGGSAGVVGEVEEDLSSGNNVQVLGTEYLESIYKDQNVNIPTGGDGGGVDEVGFNSKQEIGYYQFIVLPFQIPGKFYVVFEAPPGYRITTGTGEYWEVQEEAKKDNIFPLMEKPKLGLVVDRYLQDDGNVTQSTLEGGNDTFNNVDTVSGNESNEYENEDDENDFVPINHSGYYARSRECFSIQKSPTQFLDIDAGLALEPWPLNPFQYASFVLSIQFYLPDARRYLKPHGNNPKMALATGVTKNRQQHSRKLQSLECREYQKLKSEGIEVEDVWGCEAPLGNIPLQYEFAELTAEEADEVVNGLTEFMTPRLGRNVILKNVGLAHQELIIVDDDSRRMLIGHNYNDDENNKSFLEYEGEGRQDDGFLSRCLSWICGNSFGEKESSSESWKGSGDKYQLRGRIGVNFHSEDAKNRELQANTEIALLELGFRIRAEFEAGSNIDLHKSATTSILSDIPSFLGVFKASKTLPPFFKLAGGVKIRDVLEVPKVEEVVVKEPVIEEVVEPVVVEDESGLPLFLLIGIVVGSVVVFSLLGMGAYFWRVKKKAKKMQLDDDSSSYDSSSYESSEYESNSDDESSSSGSGAESSSSVEENSSEDEEDGDDDESSTSEEGSSSGEEGYDDDESSSENDRSPPSVGRLKQYRGSSRMGNISRQSTRSKTSSQSTRPRSIKSQSSRSWSMKSQSTRSQSVKSQSLRPQSTKSQSLRSQSIRSQSLRSQSTRSQSVRSQSTRSQSMRSQSTRSQSVRSQSTRSPSARSQSTRSQSARSQSTRSQSTRSRLSSIRSSVGSRASGALFYSSSSSMTPRKKRGGQMT